MLQFKCFYLGVFDENGLSRDAENVSEFPENSRRKSKENSETKKVQVQVVQKQVSLPVTEI